MKQPFNRTIQITNEKNRNEILYIYTVVDILLKKKKWNVPFFHITHVSFTQRTNVLLFSTRLLLEISLSIVVSRCFSFWRDMPSINLIGVDALFDSYVMMIGWRERKKNAIIKRQKQINALFHMYFSGEKLRYLLNISTRKYGRKTLLSVLKVYDE